MFDVAQKQRDLFGVLLSYAPLGNVNVKDFRKMQLDKEVDFATLYMKGRNGRAGCGLLVEMPAARCPRPNVSGPVLDWLFSVLVVENPTINLNSVSGTTITAEEAVQMVMDALHLFADDETGTLEVDGNPMQPVSDFAGCIAYRVTFKIVGKAGQTPRVGNISMSFGSNLCTLSTITIGARLVYTTDGTFPALVGNPIAQTYTAPFPITTGDIIRAVAYADGMNNSALTRKVAS